MAISTKDFTENMCITFNGKVCTITECFHISPVKGPSMVRTKLRDIKTGEVVDNAFNAAADVNHVDAEKKAARFLGADSGTFAFETIEGSEQIKLADELLESALQWMSDGDEVALVYIDGAFEGIEPLLVAQ